MPLHYGQRADAYFENRQLKSRLLSRKKELWSSPRKKNYSVGEKCAGQFRQDSLRLVSKESKVICKQRSKTKLSVTSLKKKSSMHKKLPSENTAKRVCHYSTCQNVKFNSNGINKQFVLRGDDAKIVNRCSSFIASIEKHPRSYAEIIADYSESLYKKSAVAARNDSLNNATRKSPFSTLSALPPAKKMANVAEYSELTTERNENFSLPVESFDLCNRHSNAVEYYAFQPRGTRAAEVINKSADRSCVAANDSRGDDQSYAKLIADCSESVHNITSVLNDGPVPTRGALARSSLEPITTSGEDRDTHTKSREITPAVSTMPLGENTGERASDLKESDWLREMENVMNDMRSATERRKVAGGVPGTKESVIPQPVDAADDLPDGINGFAELRSSGQKENGAATKRLSCRSNKIDRTERRKDFELQRHNYSHSSDKASNPSRRFRSAAGRPAVRKSSTQVSSTGGIIGASKQPQVKLRMVPSERESVVSIDVDQSPVGSLGLSTPKHLSVVVQSDRKEDPRLPDNQWSSPALQSTAPKSALQRSDFGPMRISISEDSAPVKQIEFSINGKPVSELKSITARAERLDVVSSADKIEIRIPFAGDDTSAKPEDKVREGDLSRGTNSNVGQILNVQISANFQNASAKDSAEKAIPSQQGEDRIQKSSSISKTSSLSNNFPKTFHSNNVQRYEPSKRADVKFNDEKHISKHKVSDDFEKQREATRNSLTGKTGTDISLTREINNVEVGRMSMRKANTDGFPEGNKYDKDEPPDDRVPSKIIPWWSSSDSFNKIKKKDDNHKPLLPPSNRNDRKIASNPNTNFIAETLLPNPKDQIPKKLTKKTQSTNNPAVTKSDFSNTISYLNSMKSHEESKSIPHYAFRLKPNQGNLSIIPKISNGLKDDQALTANKDIKKISGVKQMKSHTLLEFDTLNIKGKHDISTKEKTRVLGGKIKTPNSAQNLSSKKIEEKKNNYSIKQTKSIDDVSKNIKSKIKDILNAIKPIENSKDGLKRELPSRKPIVISNGGVKRVQNRSPIITKDFISELSTAETVSNKINKNILTKQTETKEKLKANIDVLLKEKDLKNYTTINIKALNNNDVKNMKKEYKNDFITSNSSNFSNSPELTQMLKKQERLNDRIGFQDKSKQNLKSLLEADKGGSNSLLNTRISSGTVQRLKKLGVSGKISLEEPKQNKPKNLTSVKNTPEMIQEIEKSKGSTKLANPLKGSSDTMTNKSPLQAVKQVQSKNTNKIANVNKLSSLQTVSNSTSKIKDRAATKNLLNKNINETSVTQSVKTAKTDTEDIIARIVTQNPKNKDLLSKDFEKNFNKSGSAKGNILGSAGPSRKPSDSVGFKSAGSKINSRVMSNNNCAHDRKLLMESFYSNFNSKNDIMSNSQSTIFKAQQNLSDVNMLQRSAPTAVERDGINMDRPEKSLLYSAWLQRY